MYIKTYWLKERISVRSFLRRYKEINDISLNWSETIALNNYKYQVYGS